MIYILKTIKYDLVTNNNIGKYPKESDWNQEYLFVDAQNKTVLENKLAQLYGLDIKNISSIRKDIQYKIKLSAKERKLRGCTYRVGIIAKIVMRRSIISSDSNNVIIKDWDVIPKRGII